jgi:DNA-binding SARP family transcriptional activator/tetratricopeptide (TPR) repeat protein
VEFGLLGPLLVRAEERSIAISAGKQRVLLAALLLAVNQVVAIDKLAEALWQGSPPETARVTLQNYIMRLRHTLGPTGYERIVSRPAGYLIEVRRGELDVAQFAELQSAGITAARAGAWESASSQLATALQLWRGQPLADIQSPLLAAEVPRLAEMRLAALESRIDADLHLGRHREVTAELAALAAAESLRERVHELLMLALYRSGQQAAALAAYRQARRRLVDELGVEPGPALRELNQRILQSDPTLRIAAPRDAAARNGAARNGAARNGQGPLGGPRPTGAARPGSGSRPGGARPGGARPGGARPGPAMLPAPVSGFTGREAELGTLSAAATGTPASVLLISGTAGVGKTALAVHWAHQHAGGFPGGQLYVNLRGFGPADPLRPAEALRIFLDALAVPAAQIPATLDGRQSVYRSRLAGTKTLIVLDNAGDPDQVRPLLPGAPGCLVIVTSRNQLTGLIAADGAQSVVLGVLTSGEAHHVLARRLGPDRVAAEPAAAAELARLCARLPLALAVTGARAAARPDFTLTTLAAELRGTRGRLDALTTGEDTTDVRAVFSWSYHQLTAPAARMFELLGLHPGPDTTAAAAASLAGTDPGHARRLLRELTHAHLLTEHTPGRYTFHDLLRAYAAEQAGANHDGEARSAATGRILGHYLHTAHTAALLLNPSREPICLGSAPGGVTPEQLTSHQQALAWFEAEHHVLAAALALAVRSGFDGCAWRLPWTMATFLDGRAEWQQYAGFQRVAIAAATRLGDTAGQAVAHRLAASACARLGDYGQARAHLADCLALYRQLGDRAGEARVHQSLGWVAERQGRYSDALDHNEQALELYRAAGHRAGQADALNSAGFCHALTGNYERARAYSRQALPLLSELGNRLHMAHAWDSIGYAEHHLGRLAEAAECYRQAASLYQEVGNRYQEAVTITHLGDAYHADRRTQDAREAWQQALDILDDLHHPDAEDVRAKLMPAAGARR